MRACVMNRCPWLAVQLSWIVIKKNVIKRSRHWKRHTPPLKNYRFKGNIVIDPSEKIEFWDPGIDFLFWWEGVYNVSTNLHFSGQNTQKIHKAFKFGPILIDIASVIIRFQGFWWQITVSILCPGLVWDMDFSTEKVLRIQIWSPTDANSMPTWSNIDSNIVPTSS